MVKQKKPQGPTAKRKVNILRKMNKRKAGRGKTAGASEVTAQGKKITNFRTRQTDNLIDLEF